MAKFLTNVSGATWWLNFQQMHVVTLAYDDTNSILFMTEVSVKSRRMAVTSNCVNETLPEAQRTHGLTP